MSEKATRAKHREELLELQSMVEPARNDEIARRAIEIAWRYLEKAENQAKMLEIYAARQLNDIPSAEQEPLTDKEQRIFLAAMGREMKVCEEVDRNYVREPYEDSLVRVCREIERKVKSALWT